MITLHFYPNLHISTEQNNDMQTTVKTIAWLKRSMNSLKIEYSEERLNLLCKKGEHHIHVAIDPYAREILNKTELLISGSFSDLEFKIQMACDDI